MVKLLLLLPVLCLPYTFIESFWPYVHNIDIFFKPLFRKGSREPCAYIIVVFAIPILVSSLRVIRLLLEIREYKSHQITATPFSIMISSDSIYVRHLLPAPLCAIGWASREGAYPALLSHTFVENPSPQDSANLDISTFRAGPNKKG